MAFVVTTIGLIASCFCIYDDIIFIIIETIFTIFHSVLVFLIISSLLLNLHFTFRKSNLFISKCDHYTIIILFILTAICGFFTIVMDTFFVDGDTLKNSIKLYENHPFYQYTGWLFEIFYVITTIYSITVYSHKMYIFTKAKLKLNGGLNAEQQILLDFTVKYVSLLTVVTLTTLFVLCLITYSYQVIGYDDYWTIIGIEIIIMAVVMDTAVNIICLCLQFGFNNESYRKWCKCMDCLCRKCMLIHEVMKMCMNRKYEKVINEREKEAADHSGDDLSTDDDTEVTLKVLNIGPDGSMTN